MRKRKWLDRFFNKEVKQLVLCPVCGEYTSYSNHFVPRFFGNGDTLLNPTNPYWSIECHHCKTNIKFSVKIEKELENGKKMTAKEMFEALGYKQVRNDNVFIEYQNDSHGDGDYKYVRFTILWKKYEVGYYDAVETKRYKASMVLIDEHEAITKQKKELGWI